jgi:beta-galactosidase
MPWVSIPAFEKNPYPLGNLDYKPDIIRKIQESGSAQLVNEYGWIWLWRNGLPSKLTVDVFKYYLGVNSTPEQNRDFQAYWLQLETEWLRSEPSLAGVLAFCYLANNYGYTGDWFSGNIKELNPTPSLDWFRHAFAPAATFINMTDERYTKFVKPHKPGSTLLFNLTGVNNLNKTSTGTVKIRLVNSKGKDFSEQSFTVKLESFLRTDIPVSMVLPSEAGGYVLMAEFTPEGGQPVISRRFLKIGQSEKFSYFNINPFHILNAK